MFTGIVERMTEIESLSPSHLRLKKPANPWPDPLEIGESISVDGCCLTLTSHDDFLEFDLSEETWRLTTFPFRKTGDVVNLERALLPTTRLGGHIVQGHVDGTGTVMSISENPDSVVCTFALPLEGAKFIFQKGSIAVSGVSLTVVSPRLEGDECQFEVWLIPHTLELTNLKQLRPGAKVNIEYDLFSKHLVSLMELKEKSV